MPTSGWESERYQVPSLVTKSLAGVRREGERFYKEHLKSDPRLFADESLEFLFDNHQYPNQWMATSAGWARRQFTFTPLEQDVRYFLKLDAVAGCSEVWLNGQRMAVHHDAFLPQEIDVTAHLRPGDNELAVLIRDYPRLAENRKKTLTPSGNMMTAQMRGIWQDVWLIAKGAVYLQDTIIRTSVREGTLTVITTVQNTTDAPQAIDLVQQVSPLDPRSRAKRRRGGAGATPRLVATQPPEDANARRNRPMVRRTVMAARGPSPLLALQSTDPRR